jgi:hypothetical protein
LKQLKLKSLEEIAANCREMIHRYRRKWLKKNLRPCPNNCKLGILVGKRVVSCEGCGSNNPEICKKEQLFEAVLTKEELYEQFRERIRSQGILLRDYRDIAALLWAMGGFDEDLDETVIAGVEQREKPAPSSNPVGSAPQPTAGGNDSKPKPDNPKSTAGAPRPVKRQLRANAVSSGGNH